MRRGRRTKYERRALIAEHFRQEPCPDCGGSGEQGPITCRRCEGSGQVFTTPRRPAVGPERPSPMLTIEEVAAALAQFKPLYGLSRLHGVLCHSCIGCSWILDQPVQGHTCLANLLEHVVAERRELAYLHKEWPAETFKQGRSTGGTQA